MRLVVVALVVCAVIVLGATAVGRAVDAQVSDRVLITRDGITLDCERVYGVGGETSYGNCHRVP